MTNLRDITDLDQFPAYYKEHGLTTIDEKIDHLMETMKIRAVLMCYPSKEEKLLGLEDIAIVGMWRSQ